MHTFLNVMSVLIQVPGKSTSTHARNITAQELVIFVSSQQKLIQGHVFFFRSVSLTAFSLAGNGRIELKQGVVSSLGSYHRTVGHVVP